MGVPQLDAVPSGDAGKQLAGATAELPAWAYHAAALVALTSAASTSPVVLTPPQLCRTVPCPP